MQVFENIQLSFSDSNANDIFYALFRDTSNGTIFCQGDGFWDQKIELNFTGRKVSFVIQLNFRMV